MPANRHRLGEGSTDYPGTKQQAGSSACAEDDMGKGGEGRAAKAEEAGDRAMLAGKVDERVRYSPSPK